MVTARILLLSEKDARDTPQWSVVVALAVLVYISTAFANWALNWVFYPAKVIAKSAKLVPTMIVAVLMRNSSKFTVSDYFSATLLCVGAAAFGLASGRTDTSHNGLPASDTVAVPAAPAEDTSKSSLPSAVTGGPLIGLLLLFLATTADALVPNIQQITIRNGVNVEKLAFHVNAFGSAAIMSIMLLSGQTTSWLVEWKEDPSSLYLMIGGGVTSAIGVLCYSFLIADAGSVVAVSVSTVRKIITVLLSFLLIPREGKHFTEIHAVGSIAVLAGMALGPLAKYWTSHHATVAVVTHDKDSESTPFVDTEASQSTHSIAAIVNHKGNDSDVELTVEEKPAVVDR